MKKIIALALTALLLISLIPTAFAAKGDLSVTKVSYKYYNTSNKAVTGSGSGGIAYVQAKYGDFANWQIPGTALTGSPYTWGKWIELTTVVNVEGAVIDTPISIDGYAYKTDASGSFTVTVYVLPQEGGSTVTRALNLYDANGKFLGRVNLSLVYEDLYAPLVSVSTGGINKDYTSATLSDGTIIVEVVYSKMQPVFRSTDPSNVNYRVPDYYPVQLNLQLFDKDGNKFPAFTRVDITKMTSSDIALVIDRVPNFTNTMYLNEDSTLTIEKRFLPTGSLATTLNIYRKAAILYGGYTSEGQFLIGSTAYGGIENIVVGGQSFSDKRFLSWKEDDLSLTANGIRESAIRATIDKAIEEYFKDPANPTLYGKYASATLADLATAALDMYMNKLGQADPNAGSDMANVKAVIDALEADAMLRSNLAKLGEDYALDKLKTAYDLLQTTPVTTRVDQKIVDAKNGYRNDVAVALTNILQANAGLAFNQLDEINLRLTTPNGKASAQTLTIDYRSVSAITQKKSLTLEGGNVSVTRGESISAAAKVYQDGAAVTGIPVKYQSLDSSIVSVTSGANSSSATFKGESAGQAVVRAYVESTSGGKTTVEAEAYLVVTVVELAPKPTPSPETSDYVCKVRKLNIRAGAGTKYAKVGFVSRNDLVKVYEVVNGWAKIAWNNGFAYASIGSGKYLAPKP